MSKIDLPSFVIFMILMSGFALFGEWRMITMMGAGYLAGVSGGYLLTAMVRWLFTPRKGW